MSEGRIDLDSFTASFSFLQKSQPSWKQLKMYFQCRGTLGCHCAQSCCRLFTEVTWPPCYWAFETEYPHAFYFPTSTCFDSSDLAEAWRFTSCHICHCAAFVFSLFIQPFALELCGVLLLLIFLFSLSISTPLFLIHLHTSLSKFLSDSCQSPD